MVDGYDVDLAALYGLAEKVFLPHNFYVMCSDFLASGFCWHSNISGIHTYTRPTDVDISAWKLGCLAHSSWLTGWRTNERKGNQSATNQSYNTNKMFIPLIFFCLMVTYEIFQAIGRWEMGKQEDWWVMLMSCCCCCCWGEMAALPFRLYKILEFFIEKDDFCLMKIKKKRKWH